MPNDLKKLRDNLTKSPAARARFLADTLEVLKRNGLDIDDPDVLQSLDLNLDLTDSKKFLDGLAASTVVITITQ
jgi:hypothetical protein